MEKNMNLSKGKKIEVLRIDEDAWYAATVTRSLPKIGRVSVEFEALFSGDGRSKKPLKETVDFSNVRPLPPPDDSDRAFESGDEVEALRNDGWRRGAVSGVLENSRFLVILSNAKEAKVFGRSELRVHRDWIGGRWISAYEQTKLEIDFGSGTPVEVRSDEEGFEGAWFAAKIVNSTGKNIFMIEYQHLRTDDESQLLRETVYSQNIRPVPPDILEAKDFYLLEEVDALYNDGWWVGIISKVLKDSRYIVYFRDTQEEMEFKLSELRPHQDWIGGKWVRVSQKLKL